MLRGSRVARCARGGLSASCAGTSGRVYLMLVLKVSLSSPPTTPSPKPSKEPPHLYPYGGVLLPP